MRQSPKSIDFMPGFKTKEDWDNAAAYQDAVRVMEGTQDFLHPNNPRYEEIVDARGGVHIVRKTPKYDTSAIEAKANMIADRKSAESTFPEPLNSHQARKDAEAGDMFIVGEKGFMRPVQSHSAAELATATHVNVVWEPTPPQHIPVHEQNQHVA